MTTFRRRSSSFFRAFKDADVENDDFYMDRGATAAAQNRWHFECAWEVANKGKICLSSMNTYYFDECLSKFCFSDSIS